MTVTERFQRLASDKRERIERAAAREFAQHGFEGARTDRIAKNAGISAGSIFTYFADKRGLFLHVVHAGAAEIETRVTRLLEADEPVLDTLRHLLELVVASSAEYAELVQLYHEITATGNWELARESARELEGFTSRGYRELLARGQQRGEIRTDISPETLAFTVDNIFIALQFSLSCSYFQARREVYLPGRTPEQVIADTHALLTAALAPQPGNGDRR